MTTKWRDEDLERFWKELKEDPTNIKKANAYWDACGNYFRGDIRSGKFVINTFRECALHSKEGVVALAKAYKKLFLLSGEHPYRGYFDEELLKTIKNVNFLNEIENEFIQWLLIYLE
jgi:hypothetical protein